MDGPLPIIFCVDVEPDEHTYQPDDPSPWTGFEAFAARSLELRSRLKALTGEPVRFNWALRIDPQIAEAYGESAWVIDRYRRFFDEALAFGDSIGIHPHAWRWDRRQGLWVSDHEDPAWLDHCVEMSVDGFRSRLGMSPGHHRFGARFMTDRLMNTVGRLGIEFDLTLEPGEEWQEPGRHFGGILTGGIPDFADILREPYHPDPSDYQRPSSAVADGLWTIPLSAGRLPRHLQLSHRLRRPIKTARGVGRRIKRTFARAIPSSGAPVDDRPEYRTLRMWGTQPNELWDAAFASLTEIEHRYLAFAIRSDMHAEIEGALAPLFERPEGRHVAFTTPDDTLRRLGLLPEAPRARLPAT